jgi:hypothetical protein
VTKVPYLICALWVCAFVWAQTEPPPTSPPDFPDEVNVTANDDGSYTLSEPDTNIVIDAAHEWELTFEWKPTMTSTNTTTYPIFIQVPFEHDSGFVFIRARVIKQ